MYYKFCSNHYIFNPISYFQYHLSIKSQISTSIYSSFIGSWCRSTIWSRESLTLDPSLFLALVIAPLNFREGQQSNVDDLMENWKVIAFLIFPLVFLTALGIGSLAGYLLPVEVPLSASFALGAALAPSDAVAF